MPSTYIVIASPAGQLGNRLIQSSSFIAFAKQNDFTLLNPAFNEYSHYFDYWDQNVFGAYPSTISLRGKSQRNRFRAAVHRGVLLLVARPLVKRYFYTNAEIFERIGLLPASLAVYLSLGTADECDLDNLKEPLLQRMAGTKIIFFGGWRYRSRTHFDICAAEIRKLFTPKRHHLDRIKSLIQKARQNADLLVGVHIRHGDYKTHRNGRFFYSLEQYKQKMREIETLFQDKTAKFVVCTNGGFKEEDFQEFRVVFGNNEQLEDMYTFAYCDYIIGPPSTYTAWASFWGETPVHHIYDPSHTLDNTGFQVFDAQEFIELDRAFDADKDNL